MFGKVAALAAGNVYGPAGRGVQRPGVNRRLGAI